MASVGNISPLVICFTFIFSACIPAVSESKGFSTNLIHINSPHSTYRNVQTQDPDEDIARKSSRARLAYLKAKQRKGWQQPTDYLPPPLVPGGVMYLANLSLGEPPTNVYVIVDTGSDLFWVQCAPCDVCYDQRHPIYDRTKSWSYGEMSCDASFCKSLGRDGECTNEAERYCAFKYSYEDGGRTMGLLSFDRVSFSSHYSSEDKSIEVGFGCGMQNYNNLKGRRVDGGVLGLGPEELSLVSQLAAQGDHKRTFAYCFGDLRDPDSVGYLVFGDDKYTVGHRTSMEVDGLYFVRVTGISFNGQKLNVDTSLLERKPDGTGGVIIDSGATLSYLASEVFEVVREAVVDVLKEDYDIDPVEDDEDCFRGRIEELKFFPVMTFFLDEASITLDRRSIFRQPHRNQFCLGFDGDDGASVIGLLAQQFHKFGFDLEANTLSISPAGNCL